MQLCALQALNNIQSDTQTKTHLLMGRVIHQWQRWVGSILRSTHKNDINKLRVLPGPICNRLAGAVGTGSELLALPSSIVSLMIIERRTSVDLEIV